MNDALPLKPFQAMRAYWEGLRNNGGLPDRSRIDPRGLADHLEHVLLIERVATGHGRLRLAGSAVHDILGMEARGMPLTALMEPASRTRLSERLDAVFQGPEILDIWLEAERGVGRPTLKGRLLILPLGSNLQRSNGEAIACLVTSGILGRTPRRFSITGLTRERILVDRSRTEVPQQKSGHLPVEGFAYQSVQITENRAAGAGFLRLVHSRD